MPSSRPGALPRACRRAVVAALFASTTFFGCGKSYPPAPNLPTAIVSTSVGADDVLEILVVNEEKLPKDYPVQIDGTINFPYAGKIPVAGLEPPQIADVVRDKLVEVKFLVDPQVTVAVKQYNSKIITVVGQVARPGPIPYKKGLTALGAISAAGWFTPLADSNYVKLIRLVPDGKSVTATVSIDAITDNKHPDLPLQPGDTLKVDQRIF